MVDTSVEKTYEKDGIIYFENPFVTDDLDWMDSHIGCNAVADRMPEFGMIAIRAYAKSKAYNDRIMELHQTMPDTEIIIGTAETEVNAI